MDRLDTENLDLYEFDQIMTNNDWERQLRGQTERYFWEESKHQDYQRISVEKSDKNKTNHVLYSIKDIAEGKSEIEIIEIIRNELGIVDDEAFKWNKMIKAISQIKLSRDSKLIGEKAFLFSFKYW